MSTYKWTSRDLETLPDNGKLYEVIEGELYVSKQPHLNHQIVCANIVCKIRKETGSVSFSVIPK